MKTEFTKTELISFVSSFYNSKLDFDKALKIFEIEFGFKPSIKEKSETHVTDEWCKEQGYPWFINAESVSFMKELQESGITNMMESTPHIMNALGYDEKTAKELLLAYIIEYDKFYHPENLI